MVNAVKGVQGNWGNPHHALKDKGVIDSECSRHMTGNMSYLSNFEEINGGYVAFGENPKGGKISGKGKIKTGKLDFDDVYFVKELKFNLFSVLQMCDKKNNVLFIDTEYPQNTNRDATFEVKEPEFVVEKPEFEVHVCLSSSSQTNKHDDKTKREDKGKSPVDLSTRYRKLSAEFEDFSDNSINEVNDAEDITYSDDEEDVSAEADFTNLETNITVSPIPTTRVHKDHYVTQIIGDLSLATQTKGMTRVVKDQGRLTQINNEDFHTCMFAYFLSQEEPKREEVIDYEEVFAPFARIEAIRLFLAYASFMGFMVYQIDVKSAFLYGTIEEEVYVCQPLGFEDPNYPDKRGKIDQTLFIKKQKDDILLVQVLWIQNQLLDYRKKVIIIEATVQEALRLDDAESIDCLPNEEIFTELSRMGTSWNEFSSFMASAVICLSTGRKINFSRAQVGDLFFHTKKYSSPALTQKVFANMRRVGKGFSRVETPLFEGTIVAQQVDDVADEVAIGVGVDDVPATDAALPPPTT
nr:putative ribonuclease H-like domain-containing protein [Tanacetum cinerariifolium]GEY77046.1 putative ribonuclease H-like domain-containing protein [Tanacetum cinerariifolium]